MVFVSGTIYLLVSKIGKADVTVRQRTNTNKAVVQQCLFIRYEDQLEGNPDLLKRKEKIKQKQGKKTRKKKTI